jgi:thiol:disulfide interchange protein DsbC
MNKRVTGFCLVLSSIAFFNTSIAESGTQATIEKSLSRVLPNIELDAVNPSPMEGVSEVLIGPRVLYVTNDGKYLLQGSLIDLNTREDVSASRRNELRLVAVNNVGEENMIIFPAKDSRHTITVFTDIDCGYCRKLHDEIGKFNDKGITVRYLMYPRSGPNTPSYDKAVSVWCEKDRQDALTRSKAGEALPKANCKNPVTDHFELGQLLEVRGTPALILDDGELVPGYVPAGRLAKMLDAKS